MLASPVKQDFGIGPICWQAVRCPDKQAMCHARPPPEAEFDEVSLISPAGESDDVAHRSPDHLKRARSPAGTSPLPTAGANSNGHVHPEQGDHQV